MLLPSKLTSRGQAVYAAHKQALAEQVPKLKDPACALVIATILHQFCEQMRGVVARTALAQEVEALHDLIRALTKADGAALSAETRNLAAELLVSDLPALAGLATSLQEIDLKAPLETYRNRLGEEGYVQARLEPELSRLRAHLNLKIRLLLPRVKLEALVRNPVAQPSYIADHLPSAPSADVENLHNHSEARQGGGSKMPEGAQQVPVEVLGRPEYLIKQESTRRRAGRDDRTLVSTWRMWFKSEEVLMPAWVGTECLVFLIRQQGKEYNASGLTRAVRKSLPSGGNGTGADANGVLFGDESGAADGASVRGRIGDVSERDVIWDPSEIKGALRKIKALRTEIKQHEKQRDWSSGDYLELKRMLDQQVDLLSANAKCVKGTWIPKEYQKGTAKQKADSIRKHIRKVLDEQLRQNCRPLYDHLNDKAVLRYGMKNCYRPRPRIEWEFQLKEGK